MSSESKGVSLVEQARAIISNYVHLEFAYVERLFGTGLRNEQIHVHPLIA